MSQQCVGTEVELHSVSHDLILFRDSRTGMDAALAQNPSIRQQYPGGVDEILAVGFARYKSLGGPAATVAQPVSLVVPDLNPDVPKGTYEAWANGDNGVPSGRELELASLLSFIKKRERPRPPALFLSSTVRNAAASAASVALGTAAATGNPFPGRTRPLCPYPEYAHYKGSGDINVAANFVCRADADDGDEEE